MSVYQKYKANRIWDIDFRTGSFKDRSGNYVMAKVGTQGLVKGGYSGSNGAYVITTLAGNLTDFTIIFGVDLSEPSGSAERILNGNFSVYFLAGRATLVLGSALFTETLTLSPAQYGSGKKTFAITSKAGAVAYYLDGVLIGIDDYVAAPLALGLEYINGNSVTEKLSGTHRYNVIYNTALTATEIAQLTAEMNQMPEQNVWSSALQYFAGHKFNGSSVYGTIPQTLNFRHDQNWSYEFYWKYDGVGLDRVLLGSTTQTSSYVGRISTTNATYFIFNGTTAVNVAFLTAFLPMNVYKISVVFETSTKGWTITRTNLNTGIDTETQVADLTPLGAFVISCDLFGKRGLNDRYMAGGIYDLKVNTNGSVYDVTKNVVMSSVVSEFLETEKIYFKGELAAIANEATIAAGYLENTGVQILSGSFKMITETNNSRIEKVIECVTNGSLYLPMANAALTGWRRYVNSGAGYVAVVTDLATARTIPMTAGQKLIWASEDERRSLYQLA